MPATIENQVRPEIRSMLGRLRRRIRQYVLLDSLARIAALLGVLFWLSFGMNWAYFKLSNLELPIWFRMGFGWASIAGAVLFAGWLMLPLLRLMRAKALALVLERRFPELDDRLITAVEVAESRTGHETELTGHMLQNTVDDVSRTVDRLHVGEVFERRPLRRALTAAFVMAVSIGALALVNFDAMKLWAAAYVNYDDVYWDRQTNIVVKVVAQPGDREKDFLDDDGRPTGGLPGTYKHPREEELALVVEVPPEWKVPQKIELTYRLAGGRGTTSVTLRQKGEGERRFLHSIGGLTDSIEALYVKGGDFANRRPYKIVVVDPPRIDRVVLECDYPDYTGRNAYDMQGNHIRDRRAVKGIQTALPLETDFLLHGFGNKPLVGVRLHADVNEGDVKEIEVQLRPFREDEAGSVRLIVGAMDGSRKAIDLPAETAWRFRLLPAEMELEARFAGIVRAVGQIRETRDADGKVHRLGPATAADGLEQLRELAKDSRALEESYRKLLEEMERSRAWPRLLFERMQTSILVPLEALNAEQFPAGERLLEALASSAENDAGTLDRTVEARQGFEVMQLAMNNVLAEMSNGARFDVPFHVSSSALRRLAGPAAGIAAPLPLPPDRELRIYLEDTDDIIGASPARLTINGTPDQPPVVETRLRGISTAITRRASIPVTGVIRDDYGIVKARFEFLVDAAGPASAEARGPAAQEEPAEEDDDAVDEQPGDGPAAAEEREWRIRQFRNRPEDNPLEFVLERSPDDRYPAARFEVLPLDLKIGQELTLTVYAEDGDDVNGPHHTRGEKYRFRIVSTEELLSILYGRELGIRRRFEQIIEEVQQTRQDLVLHRDRLEEADALRAGGDGEERQGKLKEIDDAVGNAAGRSFHQVSKNHSETRDVAQSFRELLEELTNNGVHTEEQVRRIEALIVLPLDGITKNDFPAVLTTVNLFKQAHERGADPRGPIGDGIEAIDVLLRHMQRVLGEMEDLVEFHEALKDLEAIIDVQTELEREARERQKKEAIEKLKKLDLD